jgi:hypothetical protein
MRISFVFISPLLSFHLYSFRRVLDQLIQIVGRGGGVPENREGWTVFLRKLFNFVRNAIKPYATTGRENSYDYKSL